MPYVARRVAYLVPTWLAITLLAFVVAQLAPGDPAAGYFERLNGHPPGRIELERTRHQLGLDQPAPERYLHWVEHAVQGDLGTSYSTGLPVRQELLSRFPATLLLASTATLLAVLIGVPLGILAAIRRNSTVDQITRGASLLAASAPSFWVAYLLIILFSVKLHVLPSFGTGGIDHLILPATALALGEAGLIARLTRSSMLEVLREDYVTTARSKGVPEWRVVCQHALRNALIAVITQIGLVLGYLLASSAIVEVIFVWPGIGRLAVTAIGERDYPMIEGYVVFAGTIYLLINLAVDLLYQALDPRITLGSRVAEAAS
ncbi:MAG TPA: ABC transporter permease [Solirubrobacteraceae bacterium]|jgi:ABC-type dipeptide/oligopeptide/nickel transport system permease component|nr:ABC transporter permease [Solirubrobacteraceae bacterium]